MVLVVSKTLQMAGGRFVVAIGSGLLRGVVIIADGILESLR